MNPLEAALDRRRADRLHHHVADRLADRGADPAVVHGRCDRAPVQRICGHARRHHRALRRRLPDSRADAVRAHAARARPNATRAASSGSAKDCSTGRWRAYERGLRWVLRHQGLTLVVAIVTVVLTGILYVVIPKGLFPVQDVGVIQGISIADNSVSYAGDGGAADGAGGRDPEGSRRDQPHLVRRHRRHQHHAEQRPLFDQSQGASTTVRAPPSRSPGACRPKSADVPGIKLYLQPEQDLTLDTTVSPNQYQFVLRGPSQQAFAKYVPRIVASMKQIKSITDVDSDLNNDGLSVNVEVNRATGRALRHHPGDHRQRALRRARPAHRLDHLQPVDPVPRDPGGQAR